MAATLTDKDTAWLATLDTRLAAVDTPRRVLALAGPSGVGKSTLAHALKTWFAARGRSSAVLAMDDFFHGPDLRRTLGEWGPDHVRLVELQRVLHAFRAGQPLPEVMRYLRRPYPRLEPWTPPLDGAELLIFEGLYTLSTASACGALGRLIDLGLFLEAPLQWIKCWRFAQEAAKPGGRDAEAMERHWCEGILPDTRDRVLPSRANAAMVLVKDANHQWSLSDSTESVLKDVPLS